MKPKSLIAPALAALMLMASAASYAAEGVVLGKVMFREKPVEGASVFAYEEPKGLFVKESAAPPTVSGADGTFTLKLPRGQYYIAALLRKAGEAAPKRDLSAKAGDLYSFYGGNPIAVDPARPAKLTLNMAVKPASRETTPSGDNKGGVDGVVTLDGAPLDGVVLFVYLDANAAFKGLGYYMSPPTGVDGSFKMRMNEGTYYIIARKRMGGALSGPLRDGDYFGYLDTNPLVVRKGEMRHVELPVVRKVERVSPGGQGRTLATGVIKGADGKPLAGMYAVLYKNEAMTDRPSLVSKQTGADGVFTIDMPLGGKFYLGARSAIGGPVEPGQLWGRYNGSPDHAIEVETGTASIGLEIKAEKVEE